MTPEQLKRLSALRQELHKVPELSGEEQATAARMAAALREIGADTVITDIGGYGVAGVFDTGVAGPTVAIRCELDALPILETGRPSYRSQVDGKAHLCGHDGHMVMVLAVAEMLVATPPNHGRVILFFQPAEETGQGAQAFRSDPLFAGLDPDFVFSLHNLPGLPLGHVEICNQATNCASRGMRIRLTGRTSHAAAPQDGVSPAIAVSTLITQLISLGGGGALDASFVLTTLTHTRIGAPSFGISPGEAEVWVTLRTVTDARMTDLMAEAEGLVNAVARAEGLTCEISYEDVFEACVNDAEAVETLVQACQSNSVPVTRTDMPQKFSEDFGQFAKSAQTAMFWLGAGEETPQLHNPDYDFPDALIPIGAGIFDTAVRRVLS